MKTTTLAALALAATLTSSNAVTIDLFEYAFNIDGNLCQSSLSDPLPSEVNDSAFDFGTGLGTISVTLTGVGNHKVVLFLDHEIDESINTWFNEHGTVAGALGLGQSWEIDEPVAALGDIYSNFSNATLDNLNFNSNTTTSGLGDVSMALAWNFSLTSTDTAVMVFQVSDTTPASGFFLTHTDPDSQASIYFSSSLVVRGQGVPDGGSTLALLLCACGGLAGWRAVFKFSS